MFPCDEPFQKMITLMVIVRGIIHCQMENLLGIINNLTLKCVQYVNKYKIWQRQVKYYYCICTCILFNWIEYFTQSLHSWSGLWVHVYIWLVHSNYISKLIEEKTAQPSSGQPLWAYCARIVVWFSHNINVCVSVCVCSTPVNYSNTNVTATTTLFI